MSSGCYLVLVRWLAVTHYLHYFDLLGISCTTCFYSCAAVDKILTDSASRGPSAVAELLFAIRRTVTPVLQCLCGCGSVAEWIACWTQAQKGLGSNRSRNAAG